MAESGFLGLLLRPLFWVLSKIPWKKVLEYVAVPRVKYKRRLQDKLIEMPFLFGDMQLSARDDYIELDVLTLSGGEYGRSGDVTRSPTRHSGAMLKFEAYRKAFIFADGGFGKTTLFRNLALRSMRVKPWSKFLGTRGLLPIYVPLKVVQTSKDFAIIDAIQSSDPYFAGSMGLRRLTRIGSKGRLLILIDGYDEMPYTGGFSHVKRELEFIFEEEFRVSSVGFLSDSNLKDSKYRGVYRAIRSSRVYLSSRREFFEYNPIRSSSDTQKWVVRGLEDRRISLVETIFSKYRSATSSSSGRELNAELFLQELMRANSSIVDMSRSPLFLTVMCYVYVTQAGSDSRSVFAMEAGDLVRTCVRLLLEDLDKYKSRNFDVATRRAMSNRRSAYPEEKLSFLRYFAMRLYEEDLSYFGEAYIGDLAKEFFKNYSSCRSSDEILRGLESQDAAVNIVRQIIMSGLFVMVDKKVDSRLFDFPHRIFREVMAVDYFKSRPVTSDVLNLLTRKKYSELLLIFVEQSEHAYAVAENLIEKISSRSGAGHEQGLLVDVLKRMPRSEAEEAVLQLLGRIDDERPISLAAEVWDFFPSGKSNQMYLASRLRQALSAGSEQMVKEWATAAVRTKCSECERVVLEASWGVGSIGCMRAVMESGLLRFSIAVKFVELFIDLSPSGLDSKSGVDVARVLVSSFYAGRPDERQGFSEWLGLTSSSTSAKRRSVAAQIKKFIAPDDRGETVKSS